MASPPPVHSVLDESEHKKVSGYADGAPWRFTGRALYQMHLVKAETARRHIPAELKLVQAFGYTLGGFYLAHYDDSPVGTFDEVAVLEIQLRRSRYVLSQQLVVLAGIVWNPPTSCAWAARVLVNDMEACKHGRKEVGLPSHFAKFSQTNQVVQNEPYQSRFKSLDPFCSSLSNFFRGKERARHAVDISQVHGSLSNPFCHISLPSSLMKEATKKGPAIHFSLPSFSGKTEQQPNLLKYSCDLSCRVAVAKPALISSLAKHMSSEISGGGDVDILEILTAKPVFSITFENMRMGVKAPTVIVKPKTNDVACA